MGNWLHMREAKGGEQGKKAQKGQGGKNNKGGG